MRSLWRTLIKPVYLPFADAAEDTYQSLSRSNRAFFMFLAGVLVVSAFGLLYLLNSTLLVTLPAHGGSLTEGVVGSPRFINPILAVSDADRDISMLVYSGLLRATPEGSYKTDLASSYTISPDGTVYTFTLRPNATFHDGTPVTADDVLFTISKAEDPALKSPERANWNGVTVDAPDPHTVRFTLQSPYAPFIQNLTVGILPKHLWQNVSAEEFPFSELNTNPVGSGPFRVTGITRTPAGIPTSYTLGTFKGYALGAPFLSSITLKLYPSESALADALKNGDVEAASGLSPESLVNIPDLNVVRSPLNRVFGVFFNQNQSEVLRDSDVRRALDVAIDRNDLVQQVLGGYGTPLTGPVPPASLSSLGESYASSTYTPDANALADAAKILANAGWVKGADGILAKTTGKGKTASTIELQFSLSTGNIPELRAAAEYLRRQWTALGASVDVKIFDQGDLSQNVIRPRKYDALLFGEVIGREFDLFAFWHSSQRNDPGLNIALYANGAADKLLEQMRTTSDSKTRASLYQQFLSELSADRPAIFLYAPDFVYSVPKDLQGLTLGFIETPSDRFLSVANWYRETDQVWPIFKQ